VLILLSSAAQSSFVREREAELATRELDVSKAADRVRSDNNVQSL